MLLSTEAPPFDQVLEGFRDYFEQKNIPVDIDVLHDGLAAEAQNVKLIFALGSEALVQARAHNHDLPIVAGMILRREDLASLPKTTGVYLEFPVDTQLRWMRRILPEARRSEWLQSGGKHGTYRKRETCSGANGFPTGAPGNFRSRELPAALENLVNTADVLWGVNDQVVLNPQTARHILLFSFRNRIPFVGLSNAWSRAGALYSLDRDYRDIGRQCGEMALRILQGEPVPSISPVPPRKLTYSLNLKAAKRMKLDIPPSVRQGAEQVY